MGNLKRNLLLTLGLFLVIFLAVPLLIFSGIGIFGFFLIPIGFIVLIAYLGYKRKGRPGVIAVLTYFMVFFLIIGVLFSIIQVSIFPLISYLIADAVLFVIDFILSKIWKVPLFGSIKF